MFNEILPPKQFVFRKVLSDQHYLMVMLKNFKETADKVEEFGTFLRTFLKHSVAWIIIY